MNCININSSPVDGVNAKNRKIIKLFLWSWKTLIIYQQNGRIAQHISIVGNTVSTKYIEKKLINKAKDMCTFNFNTINPVY